MPHKHVKQLNWGAERRNAFIEFRVFWHGRINRSDLMETFGISLQQASLDLSGYSDKWKRNLGYDKSQRAYVRGKNFTPHFITPSAEDYFAQLRAVDQGLVSREQSWISVFPGYGATPTPARGVAPETLRDVLGAIHEPAALQVTYQSMSRPEPSARWIEPHALAFDGFRWHARAFCQNDRSRPTSKATQIGIAKWCSRLVRIQTSRQRSVAPSRWTTAWKRAGPRSLCVALFCFMR